MFLGIQEGFQMKMTILEEFAQVGGKESKLCKSRIHCKESRVGVESMACFGNCRENCEWEGLECVERREGQTTKTFMSHSKEFGLFLGGNGESPRRTHNASIGIFRTNNQCTQKYIIQNDKPELVLSLWWVSERFLTVSNKKVNFSLMYLSCTLYSV